MQGPLIAAVAAAALLWCQGASATRPGSVAEQIRLEATRTDDGDGGRPLPLACQWNTGLHRNSIGWAPRRQMRLIEQGHFLLPWFSHPASNRELSEEALERFAEYYEEAIKRARKLRLPICLKATQWEKYLSDEPYVSLPPEQNPNVIRADGKILRQVSPFGPIGPWREVGTAWTASAGMKRLQAWYPDPPLVIFLSNNEHSKLRWHEVEQSRRYLDIYGKGKNDDFKRKTVADGWIERYRALQEGMREGLVSPQWKQKAIFVGYNAFGPPHLGRWGGWPRYSLHSAGRISPYPLMWDGGSPSYYVHDWNPSTDHTTWSPQVESMNLVFMKREAHKLNPGFWLEMSVWDGGDREDSPRNLYRLKGQTYDPGRYAGFVQFGMWLLRPRAVREFRGWTYPSDKGMPYFMAIVAAVDRVHKNPILRQSWRRGTLVPNRRHKHPYQAAIPNECLDEDRWFLLDADANPQTYPWESFWNIPVFSLALVQGKAPKRQWLIYAHSPLKQRKNVRLTVPDYQEVTVDVSVGGSFYLLDESAGSLRAMED